MAEKIGRKGQISLWVIIAVAIVAIIGVVFFFAGGPELFIGEEINPKAYIEKCVRESVNEAIEIMLPQGGFIDSGSNSKMYNDKNVSYLCYTKGSYIRCTNQHPVYITEIRNEILDYIKPRTEQCFTELEKELEKRGDEVLIEPMSIAVSLIPGKARINIERKITISKAGITKSIDKFEAEVESRIYDLANVAIEVASQEAKFCYFELVGYMMVYPRFNIGRDKLDDGTEIYIIKDKYTNEELSIAIRSCAIPPGI